MKAILTSLFILISMVSCKGSENEQNGDVSEQKIVKRYNVKSGKIIYRTTISGKVMGGTINGKGTEVRSFKSWGAVELVESENSQTTAINILGNKSGGTDKHHTVSKFDNGESYVVDFEKNKIYASRAPIMDLINVLDSDINAEAIGKKILKSIEGNEVGKEHVNGVVCDVWEVPGGKQWVYNGVVLKTTITLMGITTTTEVTAMDFNIEIDDAALQLPNFPIVKQEGFLTNAEFNQEFDSDIKNMKKELGKMKNMSFKEWKSQVIKNDTEMRQMKDEELRDIYKMMQQMLKNK